MIKRLVKIGKWLLAILAGIILLMLLTALLITIPSVQNFIKSKTVGLLSKKTGTVIAVERVHIAFPYRLAMDGFYAADRKNDTLLYAGSLRVGINMPALLNKKIDISSVSLDNVVACVHRLNPDTVFNYQFFVDAFSGTPSETPDTLSPSFNIGLQKVLFENIRLKYHDDMGGIEARLHLGNLNLEIDNWDLEKFFFHIQKIEIVNSTASYRAFVPLIKPLAVADTGITGTHSRIQPEVIIDKILFKQISAVYDNQVDNMQANLNLGEFLFTGMKANMGNYHFVFDKLKLEDSRVSLAMQPSGKTEATPPSKTDASMLPLVVKGDQVVLAGNEIRFDNNNGIAAAKGQMDFNHLHLSNLNFDANELEYSENLIKANVTKGSFNEKCGFSLTDFQGRFSYSSTGLNAENVLIATPRTTIRNQTILKFTSPDDFLKQPDKVTFDLYFEPATIALADAFYFTNTVPAQYKPYKLFIRTRMAGELDDFDINRLSLTAFNQTNVSLSGKIRGLPDINKTTADLTIHNISTQEKDINLLAPQGAIPASIEIPKSIALNGKVKGGVKEIFADITAKTDMGGIVVNASFNREKPGEEHYSARLETHEFDLGKLLKQENNLGKADLALTASGYGLDAKTALADARVLVHSAIINQYNYKKLELVAHLENGIAKVKSSMPDSNATFGLDAVVNLKKDVPSLKATFDLVKLDLQKLNFSSTELKLAGLVHADFDRVDMDYPQGAAFITSLQMVKEGKMVNIDTIAFKAQNTGKINHIIMESPMVSVDMKGEFQPANLGSALTQTINRYFQVTPAATVPPQQMEYRFRALRGSGFLALPLIRSRMFKFTKKFQTKHLTRSLAKPLL